MISRIIFFALSATALLAEAKVDIKTRPWYHYIDEKMPVVKIPVVERFKLRNGIEVFFLPDDHVPLVNLQIIFEGGGFEAPSEKLGVHGLWGETLVLSGSNNLDRDKLAEYLEFRATNLSFSGGLERSTISLGSMGHYFERDVQTLFEVLQAPRLAAEDFELIRKRVLQEFERRDENPAKWASLGMTKLFWGDTLRGRYATIKSVKNLAATDLTAWHKKMWRGERLALAVTGAIKADALKKLLDGTFGTLAVSPKDRIDLALMHIKPTATANSLNILPRDIPQTTVVYKAPGMKHSANDYYALRLLDFLLGGDSFNSYLTQKIRTEKGWAYSAYSTFDTDDFTGSVMLFTQTANHNLPDVIAMMDDILAKPEIFVTQEKIEQAKLSLKNKFVFLFENTNQYMKLYLQLKWDGLADNYLPEYARHLEAVTVDDVLRVARTYYKPENFTVLICGPDNVYQKKSALRPANANVLEIEK